MKLFEFISTWIKYPQISNSAHLFTKESEFDFELYQVPESHKARLAVLHFGDDALSWYRSTTVNQTKLSWSELVAAVKKRLVQSISTGAKR
jgi:hypothetical protein